jgi:glycosyltransferase involved in cell wall biosynthesis
MHQNARFDPSKGIHDVIRSYGLLRARLVKEGKPVPQLVLAGFGSVDDVEGNEIYKDTRDFLGRPENRGFARDVKVVRLDTEDQLMNFVRKESKVALQLSRGRALKGAEGWEDEVSAARMDGKPIITYDQGGPPRQVQKGTGFVVKTGDTQGVADRLYRLFTDDAMYARMSAKTARVSEQAYHMANMANWLRLMQDVVAGKTSDGGVLEAGILRHAARD